MSGYTPLDRKAFSTTVHAALNVVWTLGVTLQCVERVGISRATWTLTADTDEFDAELVRFTVDYWGEIVEGTVTGPMASVFDP